MPGLKCHPLLSIVIISIFFTLTASAQTVSTLVSGPANFDDALTLDPEGNLYASYYSGAMVSKISPAGLVTTFATGLSNPNGSVWGPDGNLYLAEAGANRIWKISPDGEATIHKSGIHGPAGLVFDQNGNLIIAQYADSRVSILDPQGNVSTLMSGQGLAGPVGLQMDGAGNLYIGNFNNGTILKRTAEGEVTQLADLPGWLGFIALVDETIYATGFQANRIYQINTDGSGLSVLSGTGSPGRQDGDVDSATFDGPNGIVASPDGDKLYISEYNSNSLRVISGLNATASVSENVVPDHKVQLNNYPNPFNPITNIKYALATEGMVCLKVFDAHGRLVETLIDTQQGAGSHEVRFEGKYLASGVYFSRLEIDGEVQTTKMLLTK